MGAVSGEALRAWQRSLFGKRPSDEFRSLLDEARETDLEAGEIVHRVITDGEPVLAIVTDGLLRIYTGSTEGREVTVRYMTAGDIFGLPTVLAPSVMDDSLYLVVQAVTQSRLLRLRPDLFLATLARHPAAWQPVHEELVGSQFDAYRLLVENVFLPVRQRVARRLLDLAVPDGEALFVHATQQEIADSVASVREVVSRTILNLRDEGVITRVRDGYAIVGVDALHRIAAP